MNNVSILIGEYYGYVSYWRVFANRELAERQKMELELDDTLYHRKGWEYFIQDKIVIENVCENY